MPLRSPAELWRRARLEFTIEISAGIAVKRTWQCASVGVSGATAARLCFTTLFIDTYLVQNLPLLKDRYKTILLGACFQYVHGIFTQLAHRMHRPQSPLLHDLGFQYLPELGLVNEWVSELIFGSLFTSFMIWSFSPFFFQRKRFYTAVLFSRLLMVLVVCQGLRILSFTVTQLPGPNYHCHLGEATAVREWPVHWWEHVTLDLGRQTTHSCGDLMFSSHTTFALVGCLTYNEYGSTIVTKAVVWTAVGVLSLLIVASRKHYSVDVLVAWYVVPLVFWTMHRRWTTKRPAAEDWPHRPLVPQETELAEVLVEHAEQEGAPLVTMASLSKLGQKDRSASGALGYANGAMDDDSGGGQIGGLQQQGQGEGSQSRRGTMPRPRSLVNQSSEWEVEESGLQRDPPERKNVKVAAAADKLTQLSARASPTGCTVS